MATFTDDEIETIKELISDWGSDCPFANHERVRLLAEKLGVWEPEEPPTEEELARREAFRNSPLGILSRKLFAQSIANAVKFNSQWLNDLKFVKSNDDGNYQWPVKIVSQLKIKLPGEA